MSTPADVEPDAFPSTSSKTSIDDSITVMFGLLFGILGVVFVAFAGIVVVYLKFRWTARRPPAPQTPPPLYLESRFARSTTHPKSKPIPVVVVVSPDDSIACGFELESLPSSSSSSVGGSSSRSDAIDADTNVAV